MFNSLRSPTSSPCPSPVRDLASALRKSPKRDKYRTLTDSQEPRISKGRLTMTGGFSDFRPRPLYIEKANSVESRSGTPSIASSSRSGSSDSMDPVVDPLGVSKSGCRYVKIPRRALKSVIGHLSPRLSKKLIMAEKQEAVSQQPMWPNVMTTYARGISTSPVQSLIMDTEPSLTAMKARAILDEKKNIRSALEVLTSQQLPLKLPAGGDWRNSCSSHSSCDDEDSDSYDDCCEDKVRVSSTRRCEKLIRLDSEEAFYPDASSFPINPRINIATPDDGVSLDSSSSEDEFRDESIFHALDIEAVPTIAPEELLKNSVVEVRNIHVTCDYIVLETAPSAESVFV